MAVDNKLPQIAVLRARAEAVFGRPLQVHSQFEAFRDDIFDKTKEHVSETTLERLWNYSTRGYDNVSSRTLDVICRYIGIPNWKEFLQVLKKESNSESEMFDHESIPVSELKPGARLRIGWRPDRVCIVRYLGANRFVTEETLNSKLEPGDTFTCLRFQLHTPLYVENLIDSSGAPKGARYGMGLLHGLTTLQLL